MNSIDPEILFPYSKNVNKMKARIDRIWEKQIETDRRLFFPNSNAIDVKDSIERNFMHKTLNT